MSCNSWPVDPLVKPDFRESLATENDGTALVFLNYLMAMECCKYWLFVFKRIDWAE